MVAADQLYVIGQQCILADLDATMAVEQAAMTDIGPLTNPYFGIPVAHDQAPPGQPNIISQLYVSCQRVSVQEATFADHDPAAQADAGWHLPPHILLNECARTDCFKDSSI
jgi:hypothetical protein